jgi:ribonuclease-3 family protein
VAKKMSEPSLFGMLGALTRKPEELPPLTLAYVGDAVQELFVRYYLVANGEVRPQQLQHLSVQYVSASAQANAVHRLLSELTESEIAIFKRGRNTKSGVARKADVVEYRLGTGLEALLGYLYLSGQEARLTEIMEKLMGLGPLSERS